MATYIVRTTMNPGVDIEVDDAQYERLSRLGVLVGGPANPVSIDVFDIAVGDSLTRPGSAAATALASAITAQSGAHTHTLSQISDASAFGRQVGAVADAAALRTLAGVGSDAAAGTASMRTLGTSGTSAAAGNDSRLSNARTPTAHAASHATGGGDLLTPAAIGAALASHTHTSSAITDLAETVQDIVAAFIVAGTNMSVTYDDVANTYTLTSTGGAGGTTDPEIVRDVIGGALVAGAGIQVTVNDAGDTITIASTAVLPTRLVSAGTGLTGGGDLSVDRSFAVNYGTTVGTAVQGNDARVTADQAATTASIRTIGTGALQAAAGNDSRFTNARTPTAHASTHASGGSDVLTPAAIGAAPATLTTNAQTGTAYTLVLADAGRVVSMSNAAANTLTIPTNATVAFPIGTVLEVYSPGVGTTTVAPIAGVTLRATGGARLSPQYSAASLRKVGTDEWVIAGQTIV